MSPISSAAKSNEYTLEFYVYIYDYNLSAVVPGLNTFEISWNLHSRITVTTIAGTTGKAVTCWPAYDESNPGFYTEKAVQSFVNYSWNFIRCSGNRILNIYKLQATSIYNAPMLSYPILTNSTKLSIYDNSTHGFGAIFLRQLRLWSCFEWGNLTSEHYI